MNIHLPAILMFTRGTRYIYIYISSYLLGAPVRKFLVYRPWILCRSWPRWKSHEISTLDGFSSLPPTGQELGFRRSSPYFRPNQLRKPKNVQHENPEKKHLQESHKSNKNHRTTSPPHPQPHPIHRSPGSTRPTRSTLASSARKAPRCPPASTPCATMASAPAASAATASATVVATANHLAPRRKSWKSTGKPWKPWKNHGNLRVLWLLSWKNVEAYPKKCQESSISDRREIHKKTFWGFRCWPFEGKRNLKSWVTIETVDDFRKPCWTTSRDHLPKGSKFWGIPGSYRMLGWFGYWVAMTSASTGEKASIHGLIFCSFILFTRCGG